MTTAHGNSHEHAIRNPGVFQVSGNVKIALIIFALIGAATFGWALTTDPTRAWTSFLVNHFFFLCLAIGGTFFAAIQWLTGAMWSAPVRRFSEAFSAYLPIALIAMVFMYFGIHSLYSWSNPAVVHGDVVLEGKAHWLNTGFFWFRNVAIMAVWILFTKKMVGNSVAQDGTGDYAYTLKNRVLSPIFLIVFGLTFTLMSFDLMMSLAPHWFSTIFGVYCFAGLFYANLASVCLLTLYARSKGHLDGIVNDNHLHDLGKFMFAFTVFWAYIGFAQFMLLWYANIPDETVYYLHRFNGGWLYVSIFLLVGKFATPFILLLPRDAKRNVKILAGVGIFMLIAEWIDILWMVQPEFFASGPVFGLIEVGVTLGFLGIFGLCVSYFLSRHNMVAIGDPRLVESVYHHHQ